ncbi:hypothetical protein N9496_02230 [Akkermansiaceae bacterium]|nr:hypothetical protein [Akkermansiaceae bacterium]
MNKAFLTTVLTALGILSLSSCVDPTYYEGGYRSSGSATFTTLPHGYSTIYVSGNPYYYHGSRWYRRSGSHYINCSRPHGYHGNIGRPHHYSGVSRLPYGYRTTYVGGSRYYNHGSTWYRKSGSRYVSCAKPSGHHSNSHKSDYRSYKHRDHDTKSAPSRGGHSSKKSHRKQSHRKQDTKQHATVTHLKEKCPIQSSAGIKPPLKADSHQQKISRSTAKSKTEHKTVKKSSAERGTSFAKWQRSPKAAVKTKSSSVRKKLSKIATMKRE